MQYWQDPHYIKLIKNIDIKSERMNWLKELQTGKNINFSYIIKTIGFNRNIFELLVVYTKSYIREELTEPEGIDMIMSRPTTDRLIVESTSVIENSMKQFLLRIMLELL